MNAAAERLRILLVDKPAGWTSHDVVAVARSTLGTRRIGHAGTLDPFATGLLILGVGRATRLIEFLVGLDKEYEGTVRFGIATDSLDPDGERVAEDDRWRDIEPDQLRAAAAGMIGPLTQTPPRYSAVKVRGVPAHRRIRRGESVELAARRVTVRALELGTVELPRVDFRVVCSSGTYVRSLAEELGGRLGTAAHLAALRRTRVGSFHVRRAASLSELREGSLPQHAWVTAAAALSHLDRVDVDAREAGMLSVGKRVPKAGSDASPVACVRGEELVAVGAVRDGVLEPRKVFVGA